MHLKLGFSLLEMMVTIALLGIFVLSITVHFSSTDPIALDLASSRIADALRYTRDEAMRSGEVHGVQVNIKTQRVIVYKADTSTDPIGIETVLRDPVSKQPYDLDINEITIGESIKLSNSSDPFLFVTYGRGKDLLFDKNGVPLWIDAAKPYRLTDGIVLLSSNQQQRSITINPYTGRVSVDN